MSGYTLNGIIPAIVTPMSDEDTVDLDSFDSYLKWIIGQGIVGVAVNVDTGEGPTLERDERRELLEVARERLGSTGVLVAGTVGSSTREVKAEARIAREAGADVALVFPNTGFRGDPLNLAALKNYYREISEYGDIDLMLFLLQDALGGIEYDKASISAIASLDRLVAVKEATFDISKFKETLTLFRELEEVHDREIAFLTGNDNFILESFLWGCDGALIGAAAQDTRRIVECFESSVNGDWDRAVELSHRLQPLVDAVFAPPIRKYRARLKACLYLQGVIPNKVVRPPLVEVPDERLGYWRQVLRDAGLEVER
ncbi:MAG: dihydrodipicolinate synthase family protein [Candidatus Bathyarchaeota archaeon]